MPATRTPGITRSRDGRFFIDKRYRGIGIGMRVGVVDQEQAEQRLRVEMKQIDLELARAHSRPRFADCVTRYLMQSQELRSLEAIRVHVRLLLPFIGDLELNQVHDATPECRRPPYPITWDEQDRLFPKLPAHLARMALFAVNTGLRDSNVCGLQWSWELFVPEIGRSVFVIPAEAFKTRRPHVVILNEHRLAASAPRSRLALGACA